MSPMARDKNLRLIKNVDWAVPFQIYSDGKRLKQVIINLISNAIKFTDKGGIKVSSHMSSKYKDLLQISVKDTGIGISKQIREELFRPFSTFNVGGLRNKTGVGLGLVICKNIVTHLGPFDKVFNTNK